MGGAAGVSMTAADPEQCLTEYLGPDPEAYRRLVVDMDPTGRIPVLSVNGPATPRPLWNWTAISKA